MRRRSLADRDEKENRVVYVRLVADWTDSQGEQHLAGELVDVDAATLAVLEAAGATAGADDWVGPTGSDAEEDWSAWSGPTGGGESESWAGPG
jgi:hypothetical protein